MKQKVKRFKYLKGEFSGKYRGEMNDSLFSSGSSYRLDFYDCHFNNCRVYVTDEEINPRSARIIDRAVLRDVNIELLDEAGNKSYYKDDVENVKIFNYSFTDVMKDGNETYGTIKGEVFAAVGYIEEVEVVADLKYSPKNTSGTGNLSGKIGSTTGTKRAAQENDMYSGCINAISASVVGVLLFAVTSLIKFRGAGIILLILAGLWLLLYAVSKVPASGKVLPRLLGWIFAIAMMYGVYNVFLKRHRSAYVPLADRLDHRYEGNENEGEGHASSDQVHHLSWYNYDYSRHFNADVKVSADDFNACHDKRLSIVNPLITEYEWQELYTALYNSDRFHLNAVYKMFSDLGKKKKLSKREFLEMVVTCVQNIRYSKVIEGDCAQDEDYTSKKLFSWEDTIGCLGYTRFGIQSPGEFAYNLLGDCDTRTVFLYTVLTHFKYDVLVFCSLEYEHSVLGINIPASGIYKTVNNKKYYLWETTYPDWTIGNITPNMTDTYFWHVFLPPARNDDQT